MTIPWDKFLPRPCAHEPEPLYPRHASLPVEPPGCRCIACMLGLGPGQTPNPEPNLQLLRAPPPDAAAIRNAALEEAAELADGYARDWDDPYFEAFEAYARDLRALKTPTTSQLPTPANSVAGGGE